MPSDRKFEVGEKPLFGTSTQSAVQVLNYKTYALADSKHGEVYKKDSTHYVGIRWCAGNLTVNLATAKITCDGKAMGNETQTDSLQTDVVITATQATEHSDFLCTPKPKVDEVCDIKKVEGKEVKTNCRPKEDDNKDDKKEDAKKEKWKEIPNKNPVTKVIEKVTEVIKNRTL